MKLLVLFFTILLLGTYSCEGIVSENGLVHKKDTNEPIDSVMIITYLDKVISDTVFSSEDGTFESSQFTGCTPNCPELSLQFLKKGFKARTIDPKKYRVTNNQPNGGLQIYLERE